MNQGDEKNLRQKINPTDVHAKNLSNQNVHEPLVGAVEFMQEANSVNKIKELLAPYYDEFHFANYE
ncbi:MAG TPA: hypothetical protein VFW07_11050 [Parafilimonas sp.]|nr:hypothetical protein [Parafilimonas sp.]